MPTSPRLGALPLAATLMAVMLGGCASGGSEGGPLERAWLSEGAAIRAPTPGFTTEVVAADRSIHPVAARNESWGGVTIVAAANSGVIDDRDDDARYRLDSGDKLRIFVYGQPNLSRLYTVDHEGRISVPLIGNVTVRGMTTYGVESTIRRRLGAQFVKDPQVTVDIQQNRPFFILGEVRGAGQYPYVSGMTVETAVAIAGGYSDRADERRARVTRRTGGSTVQVEVPPDYVLQPGDTVYVHERFL